MSRRTLSFLLAGVVVLLDRLTKIWIGRHLGPWDKIPVLPGHFDIVHFENRGMAFGLFNHGASSLRAVVLAALAGVILVVVASLIWRLPRSLPAAGRWTPLALGLILGGALGNLFDRLWRGSVTDFLDFYAGSHHWPAFNVADSAITLGVCLLALQWLRGQHPGGVT